ncbi:rhodanese-like domain-containing protein [Balneolaceae bacterium YR4-1]|uniref:Rhodanese-like domain-containing protein n=1 Tax=Halalkalibaculum roseum TaxID=2709311 RepID=A0A6M1SKG8_9BACT|nr:rhodanese-like domain-containing protein [Halalkalibaculum roseum]NGP75801.1 rhodanese-like domain-containing protein [Halalkalibaculum roseum]
MRTVKWTTILTMLAGVIILSACSGNSESQTRINPETFKEKIQETRGVIIDVRTAEEYQEGHLALVDYNYNLLNGDFEAQLDSLSKDETYYLYCRTGNRSGQAAEIMKNNGFDKVYNVGGYQQLVDSGFESAE